MRMAATFCAFIFLCLWLGSARPAAADIIHLKSGIKKEGTVVSQDENEIVLEIARRGLRARIRIAQSDIERIEKVKSPKEEYDERVKTVGAKDAKGWYELGLWCEEHDLSEESRDCFRKVIKVNPDLRAAGEKLGLIFAAGQWVKLDEFLSKANDQVAAGKFKEVTASLESLQDSSNRMDSLKKRDVVSLLCRCYELAGAWAKAQRCYDELVKNYGTLTPEVAVIRVKQKLLQEHPDGMIEAHAIGVAVPAGAPQPLPDGRQAGKAEPGKPDLVKALGEGVKAVADLVTLKSPPKVSLSDPKVMEAAIKKEAERILKESDEMVKKADVSAASEKFLRVANPLDHLQRLISTLPNLMRLGTMPAEKLTLGASDEMYVKAAERALDADLLVRGISGPLRLAVIKKRVAAIDEFIVKAKEQVEKNPLYVPPPAPNAPPDPNAKARLLQLSVTADKVENFQQAIEALEKLYVLKAAILKPMSDSFLADLQKNDKEREPLADTKKKAQLLAAFASDLKESANLEAKMQQAWAKAQANHPGRFQYAYNAFEHPDGIYHFRDKGKSWRAHSDACVNYCDEAMTAARKRRALLAKYIERPQTQGEMEAIKNFIIQVYNFKVNVQSQYNKKG